MQDPINKDLFKSYKNGKELPVYIDVQKPDVVACLEAELAVRSYTSGATEIDILLLVRS